MATNPSKLLANSCAPKAIDVDSLYSMVSSNREVLNRLHREQDRRRIHNIVWETHADFDDTTAIRLTNHQLDEMAQNLRLAIDSVEAKLRTVEDVLDRLQEHFDKNDDDEGDGASPGGIFNSGYDLILTPINLSTSGRN